MWFCWRSITTCARRCRTEFPYPSFRPSDSERRNLCFLISPFPDFSTAPTSFRSKGKRKKPLGGEKIFRAAKRLYLKLYSTHTRHLHRANCLWLRHICRPFANSARKKPLFEQGDELAQSERHGHVFGQSQTNAAHGKGGRYVYFEQLAAFELLFAVFAWNAADSHTLYRKF